MRVAGAVTLGRRLARVGRDRCASDGCAVHREVTARVVTWMMMTRVTPARGMTSAIERADGVTNVAHGACLCREVLAQTAKRCKERSNHYATFGCSLVGDVLDATSNAHRAFGKSHWIDGDARVQEAVRQMHLTDLSALVVMDRVALDADQSGSITDEELVMSAQNNAIIGIVTERDYLNAVARGVITPKTKVSEIMTSFRDASTKVSRLVCVSPQDTALAAMESMTTHRLRHIPVISSKGIDTTNKSPIEPRVLGVVSIGEILKALLAESRNEIEHLEHYILGLE